MKVFISLINQYSEIKPAVLTHVHYLTHNNISICEHTNLLKKLTYLVIRAIIFYRIAKQQFVCKLLVFKIVDISMYNITCNSDQLHMKQCCSMFLMLGSVCVLLCCITVRTYVRTQYSTSICNSILNISVQLLPK